MPSQKKITVIIPSYEPGAIITHVIETVDAGLENYYPSHDCEIIVIDSSGPEQRKIIAEAGNKTAHQFRCIEINTPKGKGFKVLRGLQAAKDRNSDVVIMLDSDLRSISKNWVTLFADRVLIDDLDFIGPNYTRDKYDSLITNHIVFPVVKSITGCNFRQPIGGEFCFSKKALDLFLAQKNITPEVENFGIDIWMSCLAITAGLKIGQVSLGVKDHNPTIKDVDFPEKSLGMMFIDVTKTLFELLSFARINKSHDRVITVGESKLTPAPVQANSDLLWATFIRLWPECKDELTKIIPSSDYSELDDLKARKTPSIDVAIWSRILIAVNLRFQEQKTEKNKRKLIETLIPVYFGRIATFVNDSEKWQMDRVEAEVQSYSDVFSTELRRFKAL